MENKSHKYLISKRHIYICTFQDTPLTPHWQWDILFENYGASYSADLLTFFLQIYSLLLCKSRSRLLMLPRCFQKLSPPWNDRDVWFIALFMVCCVFRLKQEALFADFFCCIHALFAYILKNKFLFSFVYLISFLYTFITKFTYTQKAKVNLLLF